MGTNYGAVKFVWIDLEMTGLDAQQDRILEIGIVITDFAGRLLFPGTSWIIHQSESVLNGMNDWCKTHHQRSGLIEQVRKSLISEEQVADELYQIVQQHCVSGTGVLAGNSVWQDRLFLARFFPQFLSYLHYRIVDVSTIKTVINAWYSHDGRLPYKKSDSHRVLADISESISELQFYRTQFFLEGGGAGGKKDVA